ncbi:hypothetical protein D0A35_12280 [Xanthomonas campestris]|nr:hypothetical protein D0A35_12280 [Xanthomonas campestris]
MAYGGYSVFRAIDSRDVEQRLTPLPRVHDFSVIWDEDHDTRIIAVIEEMLMAGLLPGVQFIGERKGSLNVVLAAKAFWSIDTNAYAQRVEALTDAAGDCWSVNVGMYDNGKGNLRIGHQCDFKHLVPRSEEVTHAFLLTIDSQWQLGTKEWTSIDVPEPPLPPGQFFPDSNRYRMRRPKIYQD